MFFCDNYQLQKFAEVDPKFIEEFYNELPANWKILNENGLTHLLTFNCHKRFPLLSEGSSLFADFYHPPGNVEIIFSYHGSGFFGVKRIKRSIIQNFILELSRPVTCIKFNVILREQLI
jgi:hypothetical protein